jgi:hypothetical protein
MEFTFSLHAQKRRRIDMSNKHQTREEWLEAAVKITEPLFTGAGYKVPKVRVTCGWPSRGGLSQKKRTIGQCWDTTASSDKIHQIFISPWLDDPVDDFGVLPVLIHEVVHAVVGIAEGHNKVFGKCARAVGLAGKLTATTGSPELLEKCKGYVKTLGKYPHAKLDPKKSPVKKQSTRMIKMECGECGYVARTSQKWIDDVGPCHCPAHGEMAVDKSSKKGEGDDDE